MRFKLDTQNIPYENPILEIITRPSSLSDIDMFVTLSKAKLLACAKAQPQFWRSAGEAGDNLQRKWFKQLLRIENY